MYDTVYTAERADEPGNKITVDRDPSDFLDLPIFIEIEDGFDDRRASIWLTKEQAVEAAQAILGAVGEVPAAPTASDVGDLNEGLLRLAAAHGAAAHFRYAKTPTAPIEMRTLLVSKVEEMGGHMVAVGFDDDRQEPRAYRVDRIKGTVELS